MAFPSQDEDQEWLKHGYAKPIDVDTVIWVKQRLRLLEARMEFANRIAVFDEFYIETVADDCKNISIG